MRHTEENAQILTLSRVADTLYWLSRYLERAEHTARLLDLQLHLMLDQTPESAQGRWQRLLEALHIVPPATLLETYELTNYLTFSLSNQNSLVACIAAARENARHVREQISSEMWEQINRLYHQVRTTTIDRIRDQPHSFFQSVKEGCHLFQGITDGTMNNGEGWQFMEVGRHIERVNAIAQLLKVHYLAYALVPMYVTVQTDFMDWTGLLKSCTAFEAYCKVYTADLRPDRIAEFLILSPDFPHAIRYSVNSMYDALNAIALATESKRAKSINRLVGRLRAAVDYVHVNEILSSGIDRYLDDLMAQTARIHDAIYDAYILYPADELL